MMKKTFASSLILFDDVKGIKLAQQDKLQLQAVVLSDKY